MAAEGTWGIAGAYAAIGAQGTIIRKIELKPGESVQVDFTKYQVPKNAIVLTVNYTMQGLGGAFPLEVHGNEPVRDPIPLVQNLYGVPFNPPPGIVNGIAEPTLSIFVTWIDPAEDEIQIHHLVDAARNFYADRYRAVVVPANIAAESALTPVLSEAISGFCGKDKRKDFFSNGATYSHQINVMAPLIAHLVGAAPLPDHVRGALNKLRQLRNDVGHEGHSKTLARKEAAESLVAAVFGYHYAKLLREHVQDAMARGALPAPKH